jgi:hypothetical protein
LEQMAGVIISRIGPEAIPATLTQGPMPTLMIGRLAPRARRCPRHCGGGDGTRWASVADILPLARNFVDTRITPLGFSMSAGFCPVLFSLPFWAFTYPCRSGR